MFSSERIDQIGKKPHPSASTFGTSLHKRTLLDCIALGTNLYKLVHDKHIDEQFSKTLENITIEAATEQWFVDGDCKRRK